MNGREDFTSALSISRKRLIAFTEKVYVLVYGILARIVRVINGLVLGAGAERGVGHQFLDHNSQGRWVILFHNRDRYTFTSHI